VPAPFDPFAAIGLPAISFGQTNLVKVRRIVATVQFGVHLAAELRREDPEFYLSAPDMTRGIRTSHFVLGCIHHAVGANLGRSETGRALEELVKRFHRWKPAGPSASIPSMDIQTYLQVPVVLERR
jgi:hypothetical protein